MRVKMAPCLKKYFISNQPEVFDLRTVIKPIYIILSILGLCPYSFKTNRLKLSIVPKSIYLNSMCAIFFILLMSVFFVIHIYYIFYVLTDNAMTEGVLARVNYVTEMFFLLLFVCLAYTNLYKNRVKLIYILHNLSVKIDTPNPNSTEILKNLRFQVNFVVMGSLTTLLMVQVVINTTRDDSWWKIVLVDITFLLPQMIQFCLIAFFYVIMVSVEELLKSVRKYNIPQVFECNENIKRVVAKKSIPDIRKVEIIYLDILKIIHYTTRVFEAPFLAIVLQCLHSVVGQVQILYDGIAVQSSLSVHDILNCSIWTTYQYLKIYVMGKAGAVLKLEVQKLGFSVLNIPIEKQDIRSLLEIQHLTSLIQLQKGEISLYGYLFIDATLIFKMITTSMTYVIIVMQFIR